MKVNSFMIATAMRIYEECSSLTPEARMTRIADYILNKSLQDLCQKAVGEMVKYRGTNANEYDPDFGKQLEGEGKCVEWHNSHGLYILVEDENYIQVCVEPEELFILGKS
jgi:hypothetical protein